MSDLPLLAWTTSGASSPVRASRRVVPRSSKDCEFRSMVTFGYFSSKAALSCVICSFWPPRTSWSHTVRVMSPRLAISLVTSPAGALDSSVDSRLEPGVQALMLRAATAATANTRPARRDGYFIAKLLGRIYVIVDQTGRRWGQAAPYFLPPTAPVVWARICKTSSTVSTQWTDRDMVLSLASDWSTGQAGITLVQ